MSRQEIQEVLGLDELKQTRFYQEIEEEIGEATELRGKLKTVPVFVENQHKFSLVTSLYI